MIRSLTPETLVYDLALTNDPQISPDAARIVYARAVADRETKHATSQLWLRDRDGGNARRITWSGERNWSARWSPDGQTIAFLSNRPTGPTGTKGCALYVLPVDAPGEPREVTRHAGPIADLVWLPDGQGLAYTAPVDPANPDEAEPPAGAAPTVRVVRSLDYKMDNVGYLGDVRRQAFVVDVASGTRRQLTTAKLSHATPRPSPDGRTLAVQVTGADAVTRLALIDVATGETRLVAGLASAGSSGVPAWSPAGDRILLAAEPERTGQPDFFLVDVANGEVRRLTDDLSIQPIAAYPGLGEPTAPVWLDDRRALVHAFRAAESGLFVVDAETGRIEPLRAFAGINAGLSVDAAFRYVVQAHSDAGSVGEIVVYDRETDAARAIASENATVLAEARPARAERLQIERGGFTIDAGLLLPPDFDPTKRYPVVLDVHGGPQMFYGHTISPWQYPAQCLATNGFLVVYVNPRGSTSFGREYARQVVRDWAGEDYLDLLAVVDEVCKRPYADAERVGIYGYSYGGYMTAWVVGQTTRFKAAVCGAPVFDMASFWGTSDIGWHFGEWHFGGKPHERPEWLAAHSPATLAHRATTPTLIVQGEADERCPIGQGEQMFVALARAGCEVEFARYPGGFHGFFRDGQPAHRVDYIGRVLGWFKSHLGEPA